MAYSLESLIGILQKILEPDHQYLILDHMQPQLERLLEKASVLKHLFEKSSPLSIKRMESLECRIRDAAHKAEDIIESHVANQILLHSGSVADESFSVNPQVLLRIIQEFDFAKEEIKKVTDENQSSSNSLMPDVAPKRDPNTKNIVVGLDKDLTKLKERLHGQSRKREIIPIVGMGGIGKTTLARTLYNDPFIVSHFDSRAWITISQYYNLKDMLLGLLRCIIGKLDDEMLQKKIEQLANDLYKSLKGRRYLIILDDIWSAEAWDDIKRYFPDDDDNASRVMLTTRESNVAGHAASKSQHHQMHRLNQDDSWNLLCKKVFAQENCPPQLENIGRNIAYNCRGLPLAIHVVGGLLLKGKKTQEFWESVAKDVSSAMAGEDEQFSKILSLSYNHLPHHLKPCFLYMGAFSEDYEIRASKLIRLWVAEGFLKPIGDKSMEEAAQVYLKALVDRNLILVRQQEVNGKVKIYSVHDLLRDLCVRKACQENFLHVKNRQVLNVSTINVRRVSAHSSFRFRDISESTQSMSLARSFLCIGRVSHGTLSPIFLALRLLRVLDVFEIEFREFPVQILQLVNLRFLAFTCYSELSSSISRFWNLQTLIHQRRWTTGKHPLPSEIWEMPELRHLEFKQDTADCDFQFMTNFIMKKLQTLSGIEVTKYNFEKLIGIVLNVKKLGISCDFNFGSYDFTPLNKLEILKCSPCFKQQTCCATFPSSLKNLTLSECILPWKFMSNVGMLPNLEVLKLRNCTFQGLEEETLKVEWEPTEGEFSVLKFLSLEQLNLVHWLADQTHFPILEHLVIRDCSVLKEIPRALGDISTLEMIELYNCNPSVVNSAKQIQEDQQEYGNCGPQLHIYGTSSQ